MATILLIHGIPGSARTWEGVVEALGSEHDVLVPDLLGFGGAGRDVRSDDLLAPNQARHVMGFLDEHSVNRAVLVGHDFGGPVAAHLIAADPDRFVALGIFATNAFTDTPIPFPLSMVKGPVLGGFVERMMFSRPSLAMMVRQGMGDPKPETSLHRYLGDRTQTAAIASIFAASLRRIDELYIPVERALGSVSVPAVVGWGDRDPFFTLETGRRTADLITGATFRVYEGAGHFLPEERPAELAADILALVDQVD